MYKKILIMLFILVLLFLAGCYTTPDNDTSKWGGWFSWFNWFHWHKPVPKPPVPVPTPEPEPEPIPIPEPIPEPEPSPPIGKWKGLGMCLEGLSLSQYNADVDTLLANGFTELRMNLAWYAWSGSNGTAIKSAVVSAVTKGAKIIFAIQSGGRTLTSFNWNNYVNIVLTAAQWAQDSGVYEFQIGNEEESHNDDRTLTDAQLIINLKSLATEVQAIFTNGKVSYSCRADFIDDWITAGKGDIDILAANIYHGGNGEYGNWYQGDIDNLVNAFGGDGTYLTEFAPSYTSLDDYSRDEAVQAAAVKEMIDYIKASGMTRAFYFCYRDPSWLSGFGVVKADGTYRKLWDSLLNSD